MGEIKRTDLHESLQQKVNEIGNLSTITTDEKGNLTDAISEVNNKINLHKAESVSQGNGVHGLKIEEGVWTPRIEGATTAGVHTYSVQSGRYYKMGKQVIAVFNITISNKDASMAGNVRVAGLPFSAMSGVVFSSNFSVLQKVKAIGDNTMFGGYCSNNAILLTSFKSEASGAYVLQSDSIVNGSQIVGSITYFTA